MGEDTRTESIVRSISHLRRSYFITRERWARRSDKQMAEDWVAGLSGRRSFPILDTRPDLSIPLTLFTLTPSKKQNPLRLQY